MRTLRSIVYRFGDLALLGKALDTAAAAAQGEHELALPDGERVDAFASGADDFVAKPFRAPELGARIFGLLRRARMSVPA